MNVGFAMKFWCFNLYQILILCYNNLGFFLEGLPSCQEVLVKYVDYGNIANLTNKDIRRVKQEFLSFPEKVNAWIKHSKLTASQ